MSSPTDRPSRLRAEAAALRDRLSDASGPRYWKSLDELARTPEFLEFLHREFPAGAADASDAGRRDFLRLMGASLALAGLTSACTRQPEEKVVPYVKAPEDVVPGRPLFFATALLAGGYARGVLVESHEGRPTKVEGNPEHPGSLGGSDVFAQAAILDLYDPDRAQTITNLGEIRSWGAFLAAMKGPIEAQREARGAGLRILTETVTSPSLAKQIEDLLVELPQARWHQWEPTAADNARAGAQLAFGEPAEAQYRLDQADVILSLDADFVSTGPGSLRYVRDFAGRRRVEGEHAALNRLYVAESTPTLAGTVADHRFPMRPGEIEPFARAVAAGVGLPVEGGILQGDAGAWAAAIAKDLRQKGARALVMAGDGQPPAVHAIAHAVNQHLGAVGTTVSYTAPVVAHPVDQLESLRELARDLEAGRVSMLVILGGNPVYTAPVDLRFKELLEKAALRIRLGSHEDETSERCQWNLPAAHPLESWGDARGHDGTVSILQPLIAPLFGGRTAHEVLAALTPRPDRTAYDVVRDYWKARLGVADFEKAWQRALHDGVIAGTALPPKNVSVRPGEWQRPGPRPPVTGLEVAFRPDPAVGDGRYANNGWLQELPRPLTKITWDNAVLLGPRTARRLGVASLSTARGTVTDVVEVKLAGRAIQGPAFVLPGHPEESLTLPLGYGRTRVGRVGSGVGFDAYALRGSEALWFATGAEVRKTGGRATLACTQDHWTMEQEADAQALKRHIVRSVTQDEYNKDPEAIGRMGESPPRGLTLYPEHKYEGHAWGMAIDMSACVGCNACVVACVSENNIPVVGKDQVARGREMHWIRVDRYYRGDPERPETLETHHQPVVCMQCENAPCETVCPVAATAHSEEGLNDMVYNRCVGTRYCSNNCPYKVRRFNFFLYQDWTTPSLRLMRNPDVSVRSRGVMEKCTYCVQRINKVRIDARNEGRAPRDGEIRTACEQACPAQAIVFGDVNDPQSRVSRLKHEPRNYGLLTDLNTRPRTSYLGSVRNPNPEITRG